MKTGLSFLPRELDRHTILQHTQARVLMIAVDPSPVSARTRNDLHPQITQDF